MVYSLQKSDFIKGICIMSKIIEFLKIHPETFRANVYSIKPFRVIGLIDVSIKYVYGIERVTLAFYRSSGTNSGKIKGLWYPIVGIKTYDGRFTEFTEYLNFVLKNTTRSEGARKRWLAKSLFFSHMPSNSSKIRGFSNGRHYRFLLKTGKALSDLYNKDNYIYMNALSAKTLNSIVTSKDIYQQNRHSQRDNYERFIEDIFHDF